MGLLSFLGCKKKDEPIKLKLNESTKEKLRIELKRDAEKEFDKEWVRTTNLEREIVDSYGFEGIKLIFENRNGSNYYQLGTFPNDCPWYSFNDLSIGNCVQKNFSKIKSKLPLLIKSLEERCEYIYAEKKDTEWYLHYFLKMKLSDGRKYYSVYSGGAPKIKLIPNSNLKAFHWNIPKDLKEFYTIHDGFGEIDAANYILNSREINVMGEMMNPIVKEQGFSTEGYSFDDLLEFFPDGAGNAQCFIRTENGINTTVDWDHETWEISGETNFYNFINQRMSEIDEE